MKTSFRMTGYEIHFENEQNFQQLKQYFTNTSMLRDEIERRTSSKRINLLMILFVLNENRNCAKLTEGGGYSLAERIRNVLGLGH
jgi:hypothetical protein